jgi:hypothetical protein
MSSVTGSGGGGGKRPDKKKLKQSPFKAKMTMSHNNKKEVNGSIKVIHCMPYIEDEDGDFVPGIQVIFVSVEGRLEQAVSHMLFQKPDQPWLDDFKGADGIGWVFPCTKDVNSNGYSRNYLGFLKLPDASNSTGDHWPQNRVREFVQDTYVPLVQRAMARSTHDYSDVTFEFKDNWYTEASSVMNCGFNAEHCYEFMRHGPCKTNPPMANNSKVFLQAGKHCVYSVYEIGQVPHSIVKKMELTETHLFQPDHWKVTTQEGAIHPDVAAQVSAPTPTHGAAQAANAQDDNANDGPDNGSNDRTSRRLNMDNN